VNRFLRNEMLLKEHNDGIRNKCVFICGCGGVGSYSVEAIARMGVNTIIVCDNDVVDVTNINRQIIALTSTVGKKKVDVEEERIKEINPDCDVIKLGCMFNKDMYDELDKYKIDFIIDAIDTLSCKWDLIKYAMDRNIDIISSLGMGNRKDPTKVFITTLDKTENDPVARIIRSNARKENYNMKKINVVCSKEQPVKSDFVNEQGDTRKDKYPISSMMMVPATAGIYCAYCFMKKYSE